MLISSWHIPVRSIEVLLGEEPPPWSGIPFVQNDFRQQRTIHSILPYPVGLGLFGWLHWGNRSPYGNRCIFKQHQRLACRCFFRSNSGYFSVAFGTSVNLSGIVNTVLWWVFGTSADTAMSLGLRSGSLYALIGVSQYIVILWMYTVSVRDACSALLFTAVAPLLLVCVLTRLLLLQDM